MLLLLLNLFATYLSTGLLWAAYNYKQKWRNKNKI